MTRRRVAAGIAARRPTSSFTFVLEPTPFTEKRKFPNVVGTEQTGAEAVRICFESDDPIEIACSGLTDDP